MYGANPYRNNMGVAWCPSHTLETAQKGVVMKDMEKVFEQIGKEITKTKKSVTARDVVNITEELLKENGVVVNVTTCTFDGVTEMSIGLDFSEHDKPFEDGLSELGHCVQVLEGKINTLRSRCTEKARDLFDRDCYGSLTISCHSNEMEFENKQLKQRIAELENKQTVELPFDALETANYLINATYESELDCLAKAMAGTEKIRRDIYSIDELEQIAEHLLVYCKHNKESE